MEFHRFPEDGYTVSIHAPVRMRRSKRKEVRYDNCFNSRTREDATLTNGRINLRLPVSIHAPVRMRHKKEV